MTAHEPYLLPTEDPAEFEQLLRGLEQAHLPENAHEHILVEEFAQAHWELQRARRIDREFWNYVGDHYHAGEAGIAEAIAQEKEARFRIHLRLRAQAERSYYRALDALDRMHRNRDRRPARALPEVALTAGAAPAHEPATEDRASETASRPALHIVPSATEPRPRASGSTASRRNDRGNPPPVSTADEGYDRRCVHAG